MEAQDHSPEDDNELFSADYVEKLVASFWSKVDKKIETVVSQYHTSPQAGQQYISQENAQADTNEADEEPKGNNQAWMVSVLYLLVDFYFSLK